VNQSSDSPSQTPRPIPTLTRQTLKLPILHHAPRPRPDPTRRPIVRNLEVRHGTRLHLPPRSLGGDGPGTSVHTGPDGGGAGIENGDLATPCLYCHQEEGEEEHGECELLGFWLIGKVEEKSVWSIPDTTVS